MKTTLFMAAIFAALTLTAVFSVAASADAPASNSKPTVVLVHGAWVDGSSWQGVTSILQQDGYTVIAVQLPLTALADDAATAKRVIEAQKGPVIVVGHSYGGEVITEAAAGETNVKALVYIAAFAPDAGESLGSLSSQFPATSVSTAVAPDAAGFLYIDPAKFHSVFCADVSDKDAQVIAATQKPIYNAIFGTPVTNVAWKTIPSWYLVSNQDQCINPNLEMFMAKRMSAHISEIDSSHASPVSHPKVVAKLIEQAAKASA